MISHPTLNGIESGSRTIEMAAAGSALAILAWISHFLLLGQYGFYEDDYWSVVPFLEKNWVDLMAQIKSAFT